MVYYTVDPEKKTGILLIVIGICVPLVVLPFISGYSREKGVFGSLYSAAIEIRKDQPSPAEEAHGAKPGLSRLVPKRIPFRFFLAITLIFLYMGVIRIDRARRRAHERMDTG